MIKRTAVIVLAFVLLSVNFSFAPIADVYNVNSTLSQLQWTGYHLAKSYEHNGLVKSNPVSCHTKTE